ISYYIGFNERNYNNQDETALSLSSPIALPLKRIGDSTPMRRYEEWDEKGKDSKISKIFQLTVTVLSFLAFGGYLLTLIITAIKRNQNNSTQGNVIVLSGLQNLQKVKRPKRKIFIYNLEDNNYEIDKMYRGMIMLSSAYNKYYR
ncbi:uncharacterized protein LOC111693682, partial [Trichogramma pretiosum]|uniref:uncharacterized protein LOC111693682 n=1 Tax=Trichogramma pretiosum TaxID=7493 RepID=UPI000C71AA8F